MAEALSSRGSRQTSGSPVVFDDAAIRESDFDNALPWSMIKAVHNAPDATIRSIVPALLAKHESRTQLDSDFKHLKEDMDERQRQRDKHEISLNETKRRQERAAQHAQLAAGQADNNSASPSPGHTPPTPTGAALDDGLLPGERSFKEKLRAEKSMKMFKDIVLIEATRVMNDAISLLQTGQTRS